MEAMEPQQPLEKIVLQLTNGGAECEIYLVAGDLRHRTSIGPLAPLLDQLDSVREQYSITASEIVLESRSLSPECGAPSPSGWKGGILKRTKSGKKRGRKSRRGGFKQDEAPAWFTRATVEKAFHLLHSLELLELPTRLARDLDQVHEKAKTAEPYERASLETSQVTFEREFAKAMLVANCAGYRPEDVAQVKSFAEEFRGKRLWAACQAFETECATALSRLPPRAAKQAKAPPASFPSNELPVLDDSTFNATDGAGAQKDDATSTQKTRTPIDQSSGVKAPTTFRQSSTEKAEAPVSSTAEGKQQLAKVAASVVNGGTTIKAEKAAPSSTGEEQEARDEGRASAGVSTDAAGKGQKVDAKQEGQEELPNGNGVGQTSEANGSEQRSLRSASEQSAESKPSNKDSDNGTAEEKLASHPPTSLPSTHEQDNEAASQGSQDDLFDIEHGVASSSPVLPSSPARGARPLSWSDEEGGLRLARHSYEGMAAIGVAGPEAGNGDQSNNETVPSAAEGASEEKGAVSIGVEREDEHADAGGRVAEHGVSTHGQGQGRGEETPGPGTVEPVCVAASAQGAEEPTSKSSSKSEERAPSPAGALQLPVVSEIDRLWLATKARLFALPDRSVGSFVRESVPRTKQQLDVASDVSEAGSSSESGKSGRNVAPEASQVLSVTSERAEGRGELLGEAAEAEEGAGDGRTGQDDGGHKAVSDRLETGPSPAVEKADEESSSSSRKVGRGAVAAGVAVAAVGGVAAAAAVAVTQAPRGSPSLAAIPDIPAKHSSTENHSSALTDAAPAKSSYPPSPTEGTASEPHSLHSGPDPASHVQASKSRSYDKPWLSHAVLPAANGAPGVDLKKSEGGAKDGERRVSDGRARRESMSSYKERRQAKMKEQEEKIRGEHEAKLKALEDALEKRKAEMAERSRRSALLAAAAANRRGGQTAGVPNGTPEEDKAQARERLRKYRSDKGLSSAEPSPPAGSRVNQLLAKLGNMVGTNSTGQSLEETKATEGTSNESPPGTGKRLAASPPKSSLNRSQEGRSPRGLLPGARESPRGTPPGAKSGWASPRSQSTPRSRSGSAKGVVGNKISLPVGEQEFGRSISPGRGSIVRTPQAPHGGPSPSRPPLSALGPGQASPGRASLATTPRSADSPYPSPRGPLTGRSSPKSGGWNKPEANTPAKTPLAQVRSRGTATPQSEKRPSSVFSRGGPHPPQKTTSQGSTFGRSPRQSAPVTPGISRRSTSVGTFGGAARSASPGTFGRAARSDPVGGRKQTGQAASKFVRPTSASTVHRRVEVLPESDRVGKKAGNSLGAVQPRGLANGQKAADAAKPAWSSGVRVIVTDSASASKSRDRFGNRTALPPTPHPPSRPWRTASAEETPRRSSVSGTPRSASMSATRTAPPQSLKKAFGSGGSNPPPAKAPSEPRPRRSRHSIAAVPQSPAAAATPRRSSGGWGAATSTRETGKVPPKADVSRAAPKTSSFLLSPKDRLLSQTKASQAKQAERALPGAAEPGPRRRERRSISGPVHGASTPGGQFTRRASTASLAARDPNAAASADAEIGKIATNVQPISNAAGPEFRDPLENNLAEVQRRVRPRLTGMGSAEEAGDNFRRIKGGFVEEWVRGTSMKEPREGLPEWESDEAQIGQGASGEQVKQEIEAGGVKDESDRVEHVFGEGFVGATEQPTDGHAQQRKLPSLLQARPSANGASSPVERTSGDFQGAETHERVGGGENGAVTRDDVDVLSTPKLRKRWEGAVDPLVIQKSPGDSGSALGKLGKLFSRKATSGGRAEGEASPAK